MGICLGVVCHVPLARGRVLGSCFKCQSTVHASAEDLLLTIERNTVLLLSYSLGRRVSPDQSSKLRLADALVLEELNQHLLSSAWTKSFRQQIIGCCGTCIFATDNLEVASFVSYSPDIRGSARHTVCTFGPPGQLTIATLAANWTKSAAPT